MAALFAGGTTVMPWGLIETVALGGVLGGVVATRACLRVQAAVSSARRRRGLFLRRRPRRRCPRCAGFGVLRCTLCKGEGVCVYLMTSRTQHAIPCPLCTMRRHIACDMCGGAGRRPRLQTASSQYAAREGSVPERLRTLVERALASAADACGRLWSTMGEQSALGVVVAAPAAAAAAGSIPRDAAPATTTAAEARLQPVVVVALPVGPRLPTLDRANVTCDAWMGAWCYAAVATAAGNEPPPPSLALNAHRPLSL
jgi:hypothetical protein